MAYAVNAHLPLRESKSISFLFDCLSIFSTTLEPHISDALHIVINQNITESSAVHPLKWKIINTVKQLSRLITISHHRPEIPERICPTFHPARKFVILICIRECLLTDVIDDFTLVPNTAAMPDNELCSYCYVFRWCAGGAQ